MEKTEHPLKQYMRAQGWNQAELARRLGLSEAMVSCVFLGKKSFGKRQAVIFTGGTPNQSSYQNLKITVDGVAVVTDLIAKKGGVGTQAPEIYWGVWNFNTSLKIEHKSDSAAALVRVAYCCA